MAGVKNDLQLKMQIIEYYMRCKSINQTRKHFNISYDRVKRIVEKNGLFSEYIENAVDAQRENFVDGIHRRTGNFLRFSDYFLDRIDPEKNKKELDEMSIKDVSTVWANVADRFIAIERLAINTQTEEDIDKAANKVTQLAEMWDKTAERHVI